MLPIHGLALLVILSITRLRYFVSAADDTIGLEKKGYDCSLCSDIRSDRLWCHVDCGKPYHKKRMPKRNNHTPEACSEICGNLLPGCYSQCIGAATSTWDQVSAQEACFVSCMHISTPRNSTECRQKCIVTVLAAVSDEKLDDTKNRNLNLFDISTVHTNETKVPVSLKEDIICPESDHVLETQDLLRRQVLAGNAASFYFETLSFSFVSSALIALLFSLF